VKDRVSVRIEIGIVHVARSCQHKRVPVKLLGRLSRLHWRSFRISVRDRQGCVVDMCSISYVFKR